MSRRVIVSVVLIGLGGFLASVLWYDLMFDVQVLGYRGESLPDEVLASVAGYYRRVTIAAVPMPYLVAAVMLLSVAGAAVQLRFAAISQVIRYGALASAVLPVALALLRIVPDAQRLAMRADSIEIQSALARSILLGHLFCLASILVFCALQIVAVSRLASGRSASTP
jgi:hypothetical protein